ncbi:hypothetical protein JTE90_006634 [Oedothorax gibbosus]|uniref:Transposable element P transposase-like GTP-binding insertion domain-containing protein n=1 Tax=Oedothorax gibbosus TaxID=931172 RepID=A0AAV6U6E6_9ARAC|nr:hypothetical protein JTE90_006634 [Oedothorax gibbosus]
MAKCLGATLEHPDPVLWFPHPADPQENVHIILDVCHMLNLIRNCWATLKCFKFDGRRIEWRYINYTRYKKRKMIKRVPPSSDPALDFAVLPDSHPAVPAVVQEEFVALPCEQPPVITTESKCLI